MLDPKVVEQKLKKALENTTRVAIIYKAGFEDQLEFWTAEASLSRWNHEEVEIVIPGTDYAISVKEFVTTEPIHGEIYFAVPGNKICEE